MAGRASYCCMAHLTALYRTHEVVELFAPVLAEPVIARDVLPVLRAAGVLPLRVGGAYLWPRHLVDAALAGVRTLRAQVARLARNRGGSGRA